MSVLPVEEVKVESCFEGAFRNCPNLIFSYSFLLNMINKLIMTPFKLYFSHSLIASLEFRINDVLGQSFSYELVIPITASIEYY